MNRRDFLRLCGGGAAAVLCAETVGKAAKETDWGANPIQFEATVEGPPLGSITEPHLLPTVNLPASQTFVIGGDSPSEVLMSHDCITWESVAKLPVGGGEVPMEALAKYRYLTVFPLPS